MLGILVEIALSWLLLYFFEQKSILTLGFLPVLKRLRQFLFGFLATAVLCALAQLLESSLKSSSWVLNDAITATTFLQSFWWDIKSVLTEELLFRGAILLILIHRIDATKSILISAAAFGVYHWFSFGVIGNPMAMLFVFIGTGLMGYAWAWAFSKSKSIMLPFGLHLGWNFCFNTIFSKGPLGELVLISQGGTELTDWRWILNFTAGLVFVPLLVILYVKYFVPEEVE